MGAYLCKIMIYLYKRLTIIFGCSFRGLPLCRNDTCGNGLPLIVHSSFSFCPARAITLLKHDEKDGGSIFESVPETEPRQTE